MDRVRLGVIGIGNMGSEHCRLILSGITPEIELSCVADLRPERREWARAALPDTVRVYDSGDSLIQDRQCDAVLIATPHYAHPPLTVAALRRGRGRIDDLTCICARIVDARSRGNRSDADGGEAMSGQ